MIKPLTKWLMAAACCLLAASSWAAVSKTHEPGTYEAADGYNTPLTIYNKGQYEVYYFSWKSGKAYVATGKSYVTDNTAHCIVNGVAADATYGIDFAGSWGNIKSGNFSGSNTSPKEEWAVSASNNSTHYVPLTDAASFTIRVKGYDQFSIAGRDGSSSAVNGHFVVMIDSVEMFMSHTTTDWTIWRFNLTEDEHTITITGTGGSANRLRGFSLRVPGCVDPQASLTADATTVYINDTANLTFNSKNTSAVTYTVMPPIAASVTDGKFASRFTGEYTVIASQATDGTYCEVNDTLVINVVQKSAPVIAHDCDSVFDIFVGGSATMSVKTLGATSLQWYSLDNNDVATQVEGATSDIYRFTATQEGTYRFYCTATNEFGSRSTKVITVNVSKVCGTLIDAVITAKTTATVTGVLGGTAKVSVAYNANGSKLNNGQYVGLTLAGGAFAEGDTIVLDLTNAPECGFLTFYTEQSTDSASNIALVPCTKAGRTTVLMPAAAVGGQSIYLCRPTLAVSYMNPSLKGMSVIRRCGLSNDATLRDLRVSGTTVEGFDADTLNYHVVVNYKVDTIPLISAEANASVATVNITQATAVPGQATVQVTAEDLSATRTYTVSFTRAERLSEDALLKDLQVDGKTVEGFKADSFSYSISLPYAYEGLPAVSATVNDEYARMNIQQVDAVPGTATVLVTAQDTTVTSTYTIRFSRISASSEKDITAFSIAGLKTAIDATTHTVTLTGWISELMGEPTSLEPTVKVSEFATFTPEGSQDFTNPVTYTVTAQDGTTQQWTVKVEKTLMGTLRKANMPYTSVMNSAWTVPDWMVVTNPESAEVYNPDYRHNSGRSDSLCTVDDGAIRIQKDGAVYMKLEACDSIVTYTSATGSRTYLLEVVGDSTKQVSLKKNSKIQTRLMLNVDSQKEVFVKLSMTDNPGGGGTFSGVRVYWTAIDSANNRLSSLMVNNQPLEGFHADTLGYSVQLAWNDSAVPVISAEAESRYATLTVNQPAAVPAQGTVQVTALNGTTRTYTISFTRQEAPKDTVATLQDLQVNGTTVSGFAADVFSYNYELAYDDQNMPVVSATATSSVASVVVTQATDVPGQATVMVTAEDGTTTLAYTVSFTRQEAPKSNDATLQDLQVNGTTIQGFDKAVYIYSHMLPYDDQNLPVVSAITSSEAATLTITQVTAVPGQATVQVIAEDSTTLTYTIDFTRAGNPMTASYSLSRVVLTNAFDAFILGDTAVVGFYMQGEAQPTLMSYEAADQDAAIALVELADNQVRVYQGDTIRKAYTLSLQPVRPYRSATPVTFDGSEAWVKTGYNFDSSKGWRFSKNTDDEDNMRIREGKNRLYFFVGPSDTLNLTSATTKRKISVSVNGTLLPDLTESPAKNGVISIPTNPDQPSMVEIVSAQTSGDGGFKAAALIITKVDSTDATLQDLQVNGVTVEGFNPQTLTYTYLLDYDDQSLPTVSAAATIEQAAVSITQVAAVPGQATVQVTALNGTTLTYSVSFSRREAPKSTDATLQDLQVNGTTVQGFSAATMSYSHVLPYDFQGLPTVSATATHSAATVSITQATAVPGQATVLVTAEDGLTTLTYTISFTRQEAPKSNDATLMDLKVNGQTIQNFSKDVYNYDYVVREGDPMPVVSATATSSDATISITQATAIPGQATVSVTAQDGTRLSYVISFRSNTSLNELARQDISYQDGLISNPNSVRLMLFDAAGRLLFTGTTDISLDSYAAGLYIVTNGHSTLKVVK